jgi:hypothetical protein
MSESFSSGEILPAVMADIENAGKRPSFEKKDN